MSAAWPKDWGSEMTLNRYVLTSNVTVAADVAAAVVAGELGRGAPAGPGNSASLSPPTAAKYGISPNVTFLRGTAIVLDPAGSLFAAIGAGNLRAWIDGQDVVGHASLSN